MLLPYAGATLAVGEPVCTHVCTPASLADVVRSDEAWVFEISTVCTLANVTGDDMIDLYRSHTRSRSDVVVLSTRDSVSEHDRRTAIIEIVEEVRTDHGDMIIRGEITVAYDPETVVRYSHVSGKIEATGAAANTRKVAETVEVKGGAVAASVSIAKRLHISKPWYAPSGIFIKEVYKGLKKDLTKISGRHVGLLQACQVRTSR